MLPDVSPDPRTEISLTVWHPYLSAGRAGVPLLVRPPVNPGRLAAYEPWAVDATGNATPAVARRVAHHLIAKGAFTECPILVRQAGEYKGVNKTSPIVWDRL